MALIDTLLLRDEGFRRYMYQDSLGYASIGIGRCVDQRKGLGIRPVEAKFMLANDISAKIADLDAGIPWWRSLSEVRQAVLLSMAFQLGSAGLLGFHTTLRCAENGDFSGAAAAMLTSRWAQQVPLRAHRLSEAMRTDDPAAFQLDEDPPQAI